MTLKGHTNSVNCLILIIAKTLASSSDDKAIKLWDISSGQEIKTLKGHTEID